MDAAADNDAAFADRFERLGYELAGGSEDDRRVQSCWRRFVRTAGPGCAEIQGEFLRCGVTCPGERVNFPLLIFCDLRDDVGCGAEAVKTKPFPVACFDQASITDETRAEQRRSFRITVEIGDWKTVSLISDRVFRVSAVERVAGKSCQVAEILCAVIAVTTLAAG